MRKEIVNGLGLDCKKCKIYVPRGSVAKAKYKWTDAEGGKQYAHMITADYSEFEDVVVPSNEIWYTSEYELVISPTASAFGVNLVSNIYKDGMGVLTFDGDVTHIGDYAFQKRVVEQIVKNPLRNNIEEIRMFIVGIGGKSTKKQESEKTTKIAKPKVEDIESKTEVRFYINNILSVFFPNSVKDISSKAFSSSEPIEYIHFCGEVDSITSFRFRSQYCVKFGGKYVGPNGYCLITNGVLRAFAGSCGERSYVIPDSVISIGGGAFQGCSSLESITIPDSVTSIGYSAFSGCNRLVKLYCKPLNPPQREERFGWPDMPPLNDNFRYDTLESIIIYVPRCSVEEYKKSAGWCKYADIIEGYDF